MIYSSVNSSGKRIRGRDILPQPLNVKKPWQLLEVLTVFVLLFDLTAFRPVTIPQARLPESVLPPPVKIWNGFESD